MFAAWRCWSIAEAGIPLGEYSPMEVKSSVVGYGRAEKAQVQLMVRSILSLETATARGCIGCGGRRHLPRYAVSAALRVGAGR